jgi:hypothetical protein
MKLFCITCCLLVLLLFLVAFAFVAVHPALAKSESRSMTGVLPWGRIYSYYIRFLNSSTTPLALLHFVLKLFSKRLSRTFISPSVNQRSFSCFLS